MRLIVDQGSYSSVAKGFVLAFWGPTDLSITHGDASMAVDNHYGAFQYYVKLFGTNRAKQKYLGKAVPYKYPKNGRILIGLFDRIGNHDKPSEDNVKQCLINLKNGMMKYDLKRVSMPSSDIGIGTTTKLVNEVFEETDFDVLIRYI